MALELARGEGRYDLRVLARAGVISLVLLGISLEDLRGIVRLEVEVERVESP